MKRSLLAISLVAIFMAVLTPPTASAQFDFGKWKDASMDTIFELTDKYTTLDVNRLPTTTTIANIEDLNAGYALGSEFEATSTEIIGETSRILNEASIIEATENLSFEETELLGVVRVRAGYLQSLVGEIQGDLGSIMFVLVAAHEILERTGDFNQEAWHDYYWMSTRMNEVNNDIADAISNQGVAEPCGFYNWFYGGNGHDIINRLNNISQAGFIYYTELTGQGLETQMSDFAYMLDRITQGAIENIHITTLDSIATSSSLLDALSSQIGDCQ